MRDPGREQNKDVVRSSDPMANHEREHERDQVLIPKIRACSRSQP